MPLRWRSIVTAKILNLKFPNFFSIKLIFFYKTDDLRLAFLYMWVKYELIKMSFSAKNEIFMFSEIFSILIPIVIQKFMLQISFFFILVHMIAIHHCAACMVGRCANQGTLLYTAPPAVYSWCNVLHVHCTSSNVIFV